MRRMLWVAAVLVLAQSVPLTLRSEQTDRYFAWTIDVPLTAAFLGAGYLAAAVLESQAAARRTWQQARLAVPGVWVFTTLTLLVTLAHLDRFHLDAGPASTRALTWGWLAVYAVVPVVLGALWWRQVRGQPAPGAGSRSAPLPAALRHPLGAQGLAMAGAGGLLLLRPDDAGWWPWPLTPLTAQAVGAWLVGLGIVAVQTWWVNRRDAAAVVFPACAVMALGQLVAVLRFPDSLDSAGSTGALGVEDVATWTYVVFLGTLAVTGLAGAAAGRGAARPKGVSGGRRPARRSAPR